MGRTGPIDSGRAWGENDFAEAVKAAVINEVSVAWRRRWGTRTGSWR